MLAVKFESEEVRSRERKKRDESKEREKKIGGEHKMLYYVTSDEDKCDWNEREREKENLQEMFREKNREKREKKIKIKRRERGMSEKWGGWGYKMESLQIQHSWHCSQNLPPDQNPPSPNFSLSAVSNTKKKNKWTRTDVEFCGWKDGTFGGEGEILGNPISFRVGGVTCFLRD